MYAFLRCIATFLKLASLGPDCLKLIPGSILTGTSEQRATGTCKLLAVERRASGKNGVAAREPVAAGVSKTWGLGLETR
jgi:hypothetical protein